MHYSDISRKHVYNMKFYMRIHTCNIPVPYASEDTTNEDIQYHKREDLGEHTQHIQQQTTHHLECFSIGTLKASHLAKNKVTCNSQKTVHLLADMASVAMNKVYLWYQWAERQINVKTARQ